MDLPTYFIDVTPFVPLLTDGNPHNFSLDVTSAEPDHAIQQNWFLSAALQVFLDSSSKPTTGKMTLYSVDPFSQTTTTGSVGNNDVNITVTASRALRIESTIVSGSGQVNHVAFTQNLQYSNVQSYLNDAQVQVAYFADYNLFLRSPIVFFRTSSKPQMDQSSRHTTACPSLSTSSPTHWPSTSPTWMQTGVTVRTIFRSDCPH